MLTKTDAIWFVYALFVYYAGVRAATDGDLRGLFTMLFAIFVLFGRFMAYNTLISSDKDEYL